MKPTMFHTSWVAAFLVLPLSPYIASALEFRPLELLSVATEQHSLKTATGRTLSDHRSNRSRHLTADAELRSSNYTAELRTSNSTNATSQLHLSNRHLTAHAELQMSNRTNATSNGSSMLLQV